MRYHLRSHAAERAPDRDFLPLDQTQHIFRIETPGAINRLGSRGQHHDGTGVETRKMKQRCGDECGRSRGISARELAEFARDQYPLQAQDSVHLYKSQQRAVRHDHTLGPSRGSTGEENQRRVVFDDGGIGQNGFACELFQRTEIRFDLED